MPIYEYKRPDGTTFEVVQSFSEDPLTKDPDTGVPVERVLHAPAVHFKGKGFYNTDYGTRKRQRETAAAESASSDSSAASSSEGASSSTGGEGASGDAGKDTAGKDTAGKGEAKKGGAASKPAEKGTGKPVSAAK